MEIRAKNGRPLTTPALPPTKGLALDSNQLRGTSVKFFPRPFLTPCYEYNQHDKCAYYKRSDEFLLLGGGHVFSQLSQTFARRGVVSNILV